MNKGDVFAIDIGVAYRRAAKALHGKFIVAWCYGPAGKMGSGEPMNRFAVGDALFAKKPTIAELRKRRLGIQILTNNNPAGIPAVYDNPDGEDRCATFLGTLSKLPALTPKHIRLREWGRWGNMALDFNYHWRELHDAKALKRARDDADAKERRSATKKRAKR